MIQAPQNIKARTGSSSVTAQTKKTDTLVLYSPDTDLCLSLRLFFQDRYNVITTTDPEMLVPTVRSFPPLLVIVDAIPTEKMQQRFEIIKRENIRARIVLFYANDSTKKQLLGKTPLLVDKVLSKPVDLDELTKGIDDLVADRSEKYSADSPR